MWVGLQADAFPSMQQDPSGRGPSFVRAPGANQNRPA
jgi:hypothetical protein